MALSTPFRIRLPEEAAAVIEQEPDALAEEFHVASRKLQCNGLDRGTELPNQYERSVPRGRDHRDVVEHIERVVRLAARLPVEALPNHTKKRGGQDRFTTGNSGP